MWVFRGFGESVSSLGRRGVLTCNDIFLMKKQSILLLHEEPDMVMEVSSLFSFPEGLHLESIEPQGADLLVAVISTRSSSCCPLLVIDLKVRRNLSVDCLHVEPSGQKTLP
jgi:hypothetical protein